MPFELSFIGKQWNLTAIWIYLFWISTLVDAGTVRIDDADGAISYSGPWQNGNDCSSCWAHPDAGQAHEGTWHDAGYSNAADRALEFTFRGTQINGYALISDFSITVANQSNTPGCITYIDGASTGQFEISLSRTNSYQYNVPMVQITGLFDATHTLRIEVRPRFTLLFDYLVYTTADTESSNSSTGTSTDTSTSSGSTISGSQYSTGTSTGLSASGLPNGNNNNNQQNTADVGAPVGNSNTSTGHNTSKGLSTSSTIGISLGAVALILLVIFFALMRRRHNRKLKARSPYIGIGVVEPSADGTNTIGPYNIPETSANSVIVNWSFRPSSDGRLTSEDSSQQHPDGAWLQMVGLGPPPTSNDALLQPPGAPSGLIVPRPMHLNAALNELDIQEQRERRRRQNTNQDGEDYSYIRTPPVDGRATANSIQASSIRAMTAPPPYVRSPPIGMPLIMDDGDDTPDYRA
ncbi:hypothetical protein CPB86DRAFT_733251 [Serendipita vermifera]|nr:hypothetical protein CPB86DRAFT_733251 [Serendipita vermifera]